MARTSNLEAQLTVLTQDFVARIVDVLRSASFKEVAGFSALSVRPGPRGRKPSAPTEGAAERGEKGPRGRRPRQTAGRRAELGQRVLQVLQRAQGPLGVRALSGELGVAPDLLAAPLKELRAEGQVLKHGEKRNTTYSVR